MDVVVLFLFCGYKCSGVGGALGGALGGAFSFVGGASLNL